MATGARNVGFDARSGTWFLSPAGGARSGEYATQELAIAAATAELAAAGGGELRIQGEDGLIRQTKSIAARSKTTLSAAEVADAIQAGAARIAGGETTDAGDEALEKVLLVGPDTASKMRFRQRTAGWTSFSSARGSSAPCLESS